MPEGEEIKIERGFTLMELIVTIAIFAILLSAVLGTFGALSRASAAANEKIALSSLATNYLEVVRNMPYSQVGTLEGNPHGNLPDLDDAITQTINGNKYSIYYKVTYIHDSADTATLQRNLILSHCCGVGAPLHSANVASVTRRCASRKRA